MMKYVSYFETSYGTGVVEGSDAGICRVHLPHELTNSGIKSGKYLETVSSELTERASNMLKQYFNGQLQQFENIPVDLDCNGSFRLHVLEAIRSIPSGVVKSYGEVARMVGSPGSARAVGGAMASNPVPIIIPCHRIIAANGRLTGYTAPGGLEMKKKLLQMEGVEFKGELVCQEK